MSLRGGARRSLTPDAIPVGYLGRDTGTDWSPGRTHRQAANASLNKG
jgi:hypothetical protein